MEKWIMANPGEYSGIREAVEEILSKPDYEGPSTILAELPSEDSIIEWTKALSGFEAGTQVSDKEKKQIDEIELLYFQSRSSLERRASNIGVFTLNEFSPAEVLFMVCIRDLQRKHAKKQNLNPHKFSVLRSGRYSTG